MNENRIEHLPTAAQYAEELRRVRRVQYHRSLLLRMMGILLVGAAMLVLISAFCLPVLRVTGSGMAPSLQQNDVVICSAWSDYECGDIIAFEYHSKILLKRVIGLPGDVITIDAEGMVSVNGIALEEPYVEDLSLGQCDLTFPYAVPENRVFVMGDQRQISVDSRASTVGCIADESIIGRVMFRVLPLAQISLL